MNIRPKSLKEVAEQSASLPEFGRHLRDWLHELRRASSRSQAAASVAEEPPRLHEKFPQGYIADAWLAAYAEHLAQKVDRTAPAWAFAPERIAVDPIFDEGSDSPTLRALALAHAPAAFKRRNIFTPSVDLPLRLRAGRPTKTLEEKRKNNAERQRRFRKARLEETRTYYKWLADMPEAERDKRFRERFERIDANHDGTIDAAERTAWRERQRAYYGGTGKSGARQPASVPQPDAKKDIAAPPAASAPAASR